MQLHLDPVSSPHRFEFTCLAAGTVVDTSQNYRPVCLPFRAFPHFDDDLYSEEKFVPQIHLPSAAVYRKRHSLSAFLFSHKGKWLIASHAGLCIYGTDYIHIRLLAFFFALYINTLQLRDCVYDRNASGLQASQSV